MFRKMLAVLAMTTLFSTAACTDGITKVDTTDTVETECRKCDITTPTPVPDGF